MHCFEGEAPCAVYRIGWLSCAQVVNDREISSTAAAGISLSRPRLQRHQHIIGSNVRLLRLFNSMLRCATFCSLSVESASIIF